MVSGDAHSFVRCAAAIAHELPHRERDDEEICREELKRDQAREAVMLEQEKKDRESAEPLQTPKAPAASPPQK
jgi:hypothetical protein